jgi:hypothetical protein
MTNEAKPLLSQLWSNKGIDWTIMAVMAIALLGGALLSGVVGAVLSWCIGEAELKPGWKVLAGAVGYGSALSVGIVIGRTIDKRRRNKQIQQFACAQASQASSPLPQYAEEGNFDPHTQAITKTK